MNTKLTLAYTTCPNDTFIFYALANGLIDCGELTFKIKLDDVETLNQCAGKGLYDVSKLSFAALGHLLPEYALLRSGSALGRGCGPLVVARSGCRLDQLDSAKIAVPGIWTTACLLLGLFLGGEPDVVPMTFEHIIPAVAAGDYEFGVIIHEGRFTYEKYGLVKLLDLGEWWERLTSLPIPLGGIAVRRNVSRDISKLLEVAIRSSVDYAFKNRAETDEYVRKFAQEMAPSVIRRHINLYVNDFTLDVGKEGEAAINALFGMARERGILPESNLPVLAG